MQVVQFQSYKAYLRSALPSKGEGRGSRSRLAEHLRCKLGFISQVLGGEAHFSLEHGMQVAEFLRLVPEDREFFLLLLQRDRAGSAKLRDYFNDKIRVFLDQRQEVKSRIKKEADLTEESKLTYYGKWFYTAIHMCTLIPALRMPLKMARYLRIPLSEVDMALREMERSGIVERRGSDYHSRNKRIHLSDDSITLRAHHTNWRTQAIQSLHRREAGALHYSSIMSISPAAAAKIKSLLLETIENLEPVISASKDESVFALTMDLFEAGSED